MAEAIRKIHSEEAELVDVELEALLQPGHGLAPQMAIWTDDAHRWDIIDPRLAYFAGTHPLPPSGERTAPSGAHVLTRREAASELLGSPSLAGVLYRH